MRGMSLGCQGVDTQVVEPSDKHSSMTPLACALGSCGDLNSIAPLMKPLLGLFAGFAANHLGLYGRAKTTAICGDPGVGALIYGDRGSDDIFVAVHSCGGGSPGSSRGSLQGGVGV